MSTYTDLHNRVKDTIKVNYHPGYPDDRISMERVRLLNPTNEYKGTFTGTVSAENTLILNSELSNVRITNAEFNGSIILPGIGQISAISGDVKDIKERIGQAELDIIGLSKRIDNISVDVSSVTKAELENVSALLSANDVYLSSRISANDDYLSSRIREVKNELIAECTQRSEADATLSLQMLAIDSKFQESCDNLTEDLSQHKTQSSERFDFEHSAMLSTVSHDRHYEIYGISEGSMSKYPYQIKDFATNIYDTRITDYDVVNPAKDNVLVARIDVNSDGSEKLRFYDLENNPELKLAVNPNWEHTFNGSETVQTKGYYCLKYRDGGTNTITLESTTPEYYYELKYTDEISTYTIGRIEEALSASNGTILSGKVNVSTNIDKLLIFNEFNSENNTAFSTANERVNIGTEQVKFLTADCMSFDFRKYVYDKYCCPILVNDVEVANILSGNVKPNGFDLLSDIESITVTYGNADVELLSSRNFGKQFNTDLYLCCDEDNQIFSLKSISAYYNYKMYAKSDTSMTGNVFGFAVPGTKNTPIKNYSYDSISVVLSNSDFNDLNGTYKLEKLKDVTYNYWKMTSTLSGKGSLTLEFDTQRVKGFGQLYNTGKFKFELAVNINDENPDFNDATTFSSIWTSVRTPWEQHEAYVNHESEVEKYRVNAVGPISKSEEEKTFSLNIQPADQSKLTFVIPSKSDSYDDIAREWKMVFHISSSSDAIVPVEFIAYDEHGHQKSVDFYNNKKKELKLSTNVWTTIQMDEVRQNKFLITDLNENAQNSDIAQLSSKVEQLSANLQQLSLKAEQLSSKTDSEIASRILSDEYELEHIQQLHNAAEYLSNTISNDISNAIDGLSSAVHNQFIHISGDSNIGTLNLTGNVNAPFVSANVLKAEKSDLKSLSINFENLFDGKGSGSLSTLAKLEYPSFLSICNRINEIIDYAELTVQTIIVDDELIQNIVDRTNCILTGAGKSQLTSESPKFGDIVFALNDVLSCYSYKGTGLALQTRLNNIQLAIDNNIAVTEYAISKQKELSARYENALSSISLTTGTDISADNLLIIDEQANSNAKYQQYRLTFEAGTLVLKKTKLI